MLVLQPSQLIDKLPQLRRSLSLMPLLVILVQPPCCPVQDRPDDRKVLVAQFGEERVCRSGEEVFSLARWEGAEGSL